MPKSKPESQPSQPAKTRYFTPTLVLLGTLRSATRGSGGMMNDAGTGKFMAVMASDRTVKEDIVRIGTHTLGLELYLFSYKAPYAERYGAGRRIGFMADEVLELYPNAVSRDADGYLMVDYGQLPH